MVVNHLFQETFIPAIMSSQAKSPKPTFECSVCCDPITRKVNLLKCPNHACHFQACKACYKHYLQDNPMNTQCMECGMEYDHDMMVQLFSKTYVTGELKNNQKRVLLERELAQMPATQMSQAFKDAKSKVDIKERNKEITLIRKKITEKRAKIIHYKQVLREYERMHYHSMVEDTQKQLETAQQKHQELQDRLSLLKKQNQEAEQSIGKASQYNASQATNMIMKCGHGECKGFINSDYHCNICNTHYCKTCIQELSPTKSHECKKEDVETVKLILKESKPCPSCSTRISKISGCDQMWCTQCHITFSWTTGKLEKGIVHNPHYFEWLRKGGENAPPLRNPGDQHCGGLRDMSDFLLFLRRLRGINSAVRIHNFENSYRSIAHIIGHIHMYRNAVQELESENYLLDKRVAYLLGTLSEKALSDFASKRDYDIKRNRAILHLHELLEIIGVEETELLYQNLQESDKGNTKSECFDSFTKKIRNALMFYNEQVYKINKNYKSSFPILDIPNQIGGWVSQIHEHIRLCNLS